MPHIQHLRGRRRSAMKPSTSVEMARCAAPCTSRTSTPITVALRTGFGISMASPPSIWRIIWVGDGQSTYCASTRPRASSEQRWGFSTANGESALLFIRRRHRKRKRPENRLALVLHLFLHLHEQVLALLDVVVHHALHHGALDVHELG